MTNLTRLRKTSCKFQPETVATQSEVLHNLLTAPYCSGRINNIDLAFHNQWANTCRANVLPAHKLPALISCVLVYLISSNEPLSNSNFKRELILMQKGTVMQAVNELLMLWPNQWAHCKQSGTIFHTCTDDSIYISTDFSFITPPTAVNLVKTTQ